MAPSALLPESIAPAMFSASKPQGILSRKRTSNELSNDDNHHQATTKRPKVAFDPEVDVKFPIGHGEKSASVIREEVRLAIRQRDVGDSEHYNYIKSLFNTKDEEDDASSSETLQKYLLALINNTTLLKRSSSDLVNAVLQTHWLARDDAFVAHYTRFLGHLASSQAGYIPNIMNMLVANFAHISSSAGHFSTHSPIRLAKLQARVHSALKYLLQLVPSASGSLSSILTSSFPFSDDTKKAHIQYARNLLKVIEYTPELTANLLDLITDRLIKIDVQVQIDIDELEEDIEDVEAVVTQDISRVESQHVFVKSEDDSDDAEDDWSDAESDSSDDMLDPEEERIKNLKSSVDKMDALLDLLFEYYTPHFSKGNQSDIQSMFDQLLSQFQKTVLTTSRSRHTQFLLFHFAQNSPALTTQFIKLNMDILMDKRRPNGLRLSCASYVASFVARGANVSSEDVWCTFNALAKYADKLRREHEPSCRGPEPMKYTAYYATCQALIYIFCFRFKALLADPDDYDEEDDEGLFDGRELVWASGIKEVFMQNLFSKLNPLKVCAPEIVEEFEKSARHLQFLYLYHIIDANKRLRLPQSTSAAVASMSRETSLSGLHGERHQQLDAYFPFDPYHLPLSKKWLVGDYNEWKGVPGLATEGYENHRDTSDDEDDEEEDFDDERTGTPVDSD